MATTGITLKFSEGVIAINSSSESNKKAPAPTVVLCTYPVPIDSWQKDQKVGSEQRLLNGPGEYEKDGLYIRGIGTETLLQGEKMQTTSWCVDAEGIRVLIMGDVSDRKDIQQALSDVGDIDVLIAFCIKTEDKRLDAVAITAISAATQTRRIMPVGNDEVLKSKIAKELGNTEESVGKYVLKRKDLQEDQSKVILFV